MNMIDIR